MPTCQVTYSLERRRPCIHPASCCMADPLSGGDDAVPACILLAAAWVIDSSIQDRRRDRLDGQGREVCSVSNGECACRTGGGPFGGGPFTFGVVG